MRTFFLMLVVALTVASCQSTDHSVTQPLNSALSKSAPLSRLLLRVSQNQTHYDNLLDGTDCYGIGLPTVVTVNGQSIAINGENDFALVENNINASDDDDDQVHFSFPITVQFPNFEQMTINSQTALESIDCPGGDFGEIRCLDFVFPLVINTYNTDNQIANAIAIQNDAQLYNFIDNAAPEQVFAIVYPISAAIGSGEIVTISNNNELEDLIEDSILECAQNSSNLLDAVIAQGVWRISYFEGGANYQNLNFTFHANQTITVEKNNVLSYGTWDVYLDDSHNRLELDFTDPALHNLEGDWKVTEFDSMNFRLKKNGHGSGENKYVFFTRS